MILVALAVVAVGARVSDSLRLKQESNILERLPESEGVAYYEVLRKRVARVRLLRALALSGLALLMYVGRRHLFPAETYAQAVQRHISTSEKARVVAEEELGRYAAKEGLAATPGWTMRGVSGDERFPWIFEYGLGPDPKAAHVVRIYVNGAGRVEVHRIVSR